MIRTALAVSLLAASAATAHFPFLVPDGPSKAKAVFSDNLKSDPSVPVDKIGSTKLVVIDGKQTTGINWTLDGKANHYTFDVPGSGPRVVVGTTDYGVLQRGDSKPFLLQYHPKAVYGDIADKAAPLDGVPLELIPVVDGGKLRFKAVAGGKPMTKADVTVLVPGEEKSKVVATDDGGLTPAFDQSGQYGAHVRLVEEKAGERDGKKYQEVRHYATLVVSFGK